MASMSSLHSESSTILDELTSNLSTGTIEDGSLSIRLERLKVIARSPAQAPSVYNAQGISTLVGCAFGTGSVDRPKSSLEAAKILANALLLQSDLRKPFANVCDSVALVAFYALEDPDHEFVGGRIIFVMTYSDAFDADGLVSKHDLLTVLKRYMQRHAVAQIPNSGSMQQMALTETLKLAYNLAHHLPQHMPTMSGLVQSLLILLAHLEPSVKLEPPNEQVLNALAIIDWPENESDTPISTADLSAATSRAVDLLQESIAAYPPSQLETKLVTLLTVCRKLALTGVEPVQKILCGRLLPSIGDRDQPLGQSDSLASGLLKLQTLAGLTNLPEAIGGLLFDLSGKDATRFIQNIGYGHAAGYLSTHQIAIPQQMARTAGDGNDGNSEVAVNPITGQRLDAEPVVDEPEMTMEEKEREAERLFVLFERLKATGVVDVENPVTQAMQENRFEELSDSDTD